MLSKLSRIVFSMDKVGTNKQLPLISVIIAANNSAKTLAKSLASIKKQSYPQNKIESLVIDGRSKDDTRKIALKFGCKVIDNPSVGFIPAKHLGFLRAKGKFAMYLDSDEEMENPDSLRIKVLAFASNQKIKAVVSSGYENPRDFHRINHYINEFGDPFSFFIYKSTKNYEFFTRELLKKYKRTSENKQFITFDFSHAKPLPLIELVAMGCMVDLNYLRKEFPKIVQTPTLIPHFFYLLNTRSSLIAVTKNDPVIHYSADTFNRYLKKIAWRVRNNIFNRETVGESGFEGRDKFQPRIYQFKRFLFIPYSFSLIFPLIDSLYLAVSRKDPVFLVHPLLCLYTSFLILYYYCLKLLKIKPILKTYGA